AFLRAVFVGQIGLSAEGLDCLIQKSPRLAGVVGVVQVESRFRGSRCRGGLSAAQRASQRDRTQQKKCERAIHDRVGLEASRMILAVPSVTAFPLSLGDSAHSI